MRGRRLGTNKKNQTLRLWNVPDRYITSSWDQLDTSWGYVQEARTYVLDVLEDPRLPGNGLFLYGPYGTGKSCLAALCLGDFYLSGIMGYWINAFDVSAAKFSKEEVDGFPLWNRLCVSPVLVIDDLFTKKDPKFNDECLERLIRYRIENLYPTIITSNMNPKSLDEAYPAISRGMQGSYDMVKVDQKNFRTE
jgi:DNA replication protein DnaC